MMIKVPKGTLMILKTKLGDKKMIKKILKAIILTSLISFLFQGTLVNAASTTNVINDSEIPLEEFLIGTWRWTTMDSWVVIFREDNTMLDGPPGLRTVYSWQIINDRLFVDGDDWNLRITNNTITVDRLSSTYTYVWYSDSTEGETSLWLLGIVTIFIIVIIGIIVLIIVLISRRKKRRTENVYAPEFPNQNDER
jgi:hypothetical protein